MAIRPNSARTHSGTPSHPIFNDRGRLAEEWLSPAGWSCFPNSSPSWSDDPDLNDECTACGGPVHVICLPPPNVWKDPKTLCIDCFSKIAEQSIIHAS
jgi:hypothetical protein